MKSYKLCEFKIDSGLSTTQKSGKQGYLKIKTKNYLKKILRLSNTWKENIKRLGCLYVTAILSWGWGWGWVEVDIETEVDSILRLKLCWDEVESKFSWNWVEVEFSWGWDKLTLNKGRNWAFIEVGLWFKICFRSTYVAEQHMISMLLLISSS